MKKWVNWQDFLAAKRSDGPQTFEAFIGALNRRIREYTPEFAERESGATAEMIRQVAKQVGAAGSRLATHSWRSAASGNLGGWAVSRALHFLNVLTGSVGTVGGTSPSGWNKFKPEFFDDPPAAKFWNSLHFPNEFPLAHYEMSFLLLPTFLRRVAERSTPISLVCSIRFGVSRTAFPGSMS